MKTKDWRKVSAGAVEVKICEVSKGFRAYWYEGGERKQKFATKKANILAFAKATAAGLSAGTSSATPNGEKDLAYFGQLKALMGGVPLHQAVEFWRQSNKRSATVEEARLDDLFAKWKESLAERNLSPSYQAAISFYCAPLVAAFPGIIREITSAQIDAWITRKTKSLSSRRHYLQSAITLFRWARDVKKALPKGETEPELLPAPKPKAAPIQIYTPEEMALFLRYAKDEEIPFVVLGGFCGLRVSEITGDRTAHGAIQCEDLLFDEQSVHVIQKVQDDTVDRYAPLLPCAAKHLQHLRGKTGPVWDTTTTPFHVFARLLARVRAEGHTVRRLRNGFRRSFISYRTAVTRDVARVADECNTSPLKIAKNYRRPGLENVGHEWFAL